MSHRAPRRGRGLPRRTAARRRAPPIGEWDPRGRAARRGIGHVRRRHGGPDRLVCVRPRTFRPSGAGSFGGTRAIGSVEERCVHTAEVAGSNPASPTSTEPGVTPGQKLFRTGMLTVGPEVPSQDFSALMISLVSLAPIFHRMAVPPQALNAAQLPARSSMSTASGKPRPCRSSHGPKNACGDRPPSARPRRWSR